MRARKGGGEGRNPLPLSDRACAIRKNGLVHETNERVQKSRKRENDRASVLRVKRARAPLSQDYHGNKRRNFKEFHYNTALR